MNEIRASAPSPLGQARRYCLATLLLALLAAGPPAGAASWRSISPGMVSIEVLAAAPGSAGVLYTYTEREKFYSSMDGAGNWSWSVGQPASGDHSSFREFVVDPLRSETLYAVSLYSVIKSKDGGRSWSAPLFKGGARTVRVAPSAPDVVYAAEADADAILKSTDGGATWEEKGFSAGRALGLAVDPTDPRVVYAGARNGVFRSDDSGSNWVKAGSGPFDPDAKNAGINKLVIDPRQPSTIYAGDYQRLLKSTDRGATWSLVRSGSEQFHPFKALALDPTSGAIYTLFSSDGEDQVSRSTDGGTSWLQVFSRPEIQALAVDGRSGGRLYVGTRPGGVFRSDDGGGSWTAANHGFREPAINAVAADPHTPGVLFVVANQDPTGSFFFDPRPLFRSTDGGATWSAPLGDLEPSPRVNAVAADPEQPGTWYASYAHGVLRTRDGGETWEAASQGFQASEFVAAVVPVPSHSGRLYALGWDAYPTCAACTFRVYRSLDGADQWQGASVRGQAPKTLLFSLTVDAVKPSTVYVGGSTVFKSTDGGVTWAKAGRGLGGDAFYVAADPSTQGTLYAAVAQPHGEKVFLSRDGGATWRAAVRGLPAGVRFYQLVVDATAPGTVYAATSGGLYVTKNRGKLWTAMNDGLGDLPVWTVALDPLRPGVIYAGRSDGLFVLDPAGH